MTLKIRGLKYYQTAEACNLAGISKTTFLRWVSNGTIPDVSRRDRRGWRLFTDEDIRRLQEEVNRIQSITSDSECNKPINNNDNMANILQEMKG